MKVKMKPTNVRFELVCDPDGEAAVTIRQARTGDFREIQNLFAEQNRVFGTQADDNRVEVKQRFNFEELKRKRAYLTLVGAEGMDDEEGQPIFRFKDSQYGPVLSMSEREFNGVWDQLPPDVTDEIDACVLKVNPMWNPATGE